MKPQDLFVGIREFLALIVPGTLLLIFWPYNAMAWIAGHAKLDGKVDTALVLFIFLIAALGIGGVLNGAGSLIDDKVDDFIGNVRDGKTRLNRRLEKLQKRIVSLNDLEAAADKARAHLPVPAHAVNFDASVMSTRSFWWSYLRLNCPVAITELDRIEALQKQFRAFVPTAILLALAAIVHGIPSGCSWTALRACTEVSPQTFVNLLLLPLIWFAACLAFFIKYVGLRVQFGRRLFEFAILCNR